MLATNDTAPELLRELEKRDELFVDSETTGLNVWQRDRICGVSALGEGMQPVYFAFRHGGANGQGNIDSKFIAPLMNIVSTRKNVVGFNYGFDMKMFAREGARLPAKLEDVQTGAHLLNENELSLALKPLGDKYLGAHASIENEKLKALLLERKLGKGDMWRLAAHEVEPYACDDVVLTKGLRDFYKPHLEKWKIYDLWQEVNEYVLAITEMEMRGMRLDVPLINMYSEEAVVEAQKAREVIWKLAGYEINLNSAPQLQRWLGLKSTAAEILELMTERPGVQELLNYRGWHRVKANYYDRFREFMDESGILHANLNITGTDTGRLSASKPPMQAIPVKDSIYKVKDVVMVEEDEFMFEADYAQAELRVASHYANETGMGEKLARGANIHRETADENNIPYDQAKRLNFSVVYGIGAKTFSARSGYKKDGSPKVSIKESKVYLDRYHQRYPGFRRLYRRAEAVASDRGYIRMFSGRMRHFNVSHAPTHKASSNLVQGSVAEMIRIAILAMRRAGIQLFLQVHDSNLGKGKKKDQPEILATVRQIMENQPWCSVPQKVDIKVGSRWGSLTKE